MAAAVRGRRIAGPRGGPKTRARSLPASDRYAALPTATAEVISRLGPLLATQRLLLVSDFDGTLAELSADPWAARIVPRAQRALRQLAGDPRVHVAFISGRAVADLASRVRVGGASYRGDHGAELAQAARGFRVHSLYSQREPTREADTRLVRTLVRAVAQAVPETWLVVEDKTDTVTFHFRGAPDVDAARARVLEAIDRLDPERVLRRSGGRRAIELRPAGASTKGDAMRRLIDDVRPAAVLMFGDDHSDALAFDVLRLARSAGEFDGLAIAVAGHVDVTAAVAPRADALVGGPADMAQLLSSLAALAVRTR